ncbi:MAG: hypothetical protein A2Z16_08250 [Chloroflexi bacterium RBG_16_54_18]|nr:MAG: hypothetical protein A2Z16_08250 [Chloroflexi bacterium RBG_16_54_18]
MAFLYFISILIFLVICLCVLYIWIIAIAGIQVVELPAGTVPKWRFAIAIPAHDEQEVIGGTIDQLKKQGYRADLFTIFVAADNCTDQTAEVARAHGAMCFERKTAERGGKGAALIWLFDRIFQEQEDEYLAVVIFDADTRVDPGFLQVMNKRLECGANVIQGKHVISNADQGWFPALTWAMMTADCRLFSQGRSNLGLSARHMGDSICFRSQVLKSLGWGEGLTEDYDLRLRLILDSIRIEYEPTAIGYGQAPVTWKEAEMQRLRWARGTLDSSRKFRRKLLVEGARQRSWLMIDGALSILIPSFSTQGILSILMLLGSWLILPSSMSWLVYAWVVILLLLFLYPWFGLALEKSPGWAYLAVLSGPLFMIWRTLIHLLARIKGKNIVWVRTQHRKL